VLNALKKRGLKMPDIKNGCEGCTYTKECNTLEDLDRLSGVCQRLMFVDEEDVK
jgi:hypothetical protein